MIETSRMCLNWIPLRIRLYVPKISGTMGMGLVPSNLLDREGILRGSMFFLLGDFLTFTTTKSTPQKKTGEFFSKPGVGSVS